MSNLKDRTAEAQSARRSQKTQAALASIEASRRRSAAAGYAMIGGAMAYGEGSLGEGRFARLSSGARWFCLWFAMIAPVYLFWTVIL